MKSNILKFRSRAELKEDAEREEYLTWANTHIKMLGQGTYVTKEFPKPDFDAPHFAKGKAVHKALEDYMNDGTPIPYPIVYKGNEYPINLNFLYPLMDTMAEAEIKMIEENMCFGVRMDKLSWFDKKAWVRVIFDCLVIVDDYCFIIDWKTGKVKKKSDQLKLFAGAAMAMFPQVNKVLTAYVWCEHPDVKPVFAEYTRDDYEDIWEEFGDRSELIQMANESGNWPAKKNMFCRWCDALPSMCEFKECD